MRPPTTFRKEQQIACLVTRPIRRQRDLLSLAELLIAVARQLDATAGEHRLRQTGAIDTPLGASAPQVGCAGVPLLRELGQREVSRFDAQLLLAADVAGRHRAAL